MSCFQMRRFLCSCVAVVVVLSSVFVMNVAAEEPDVADMVQRGLQFLAEGQNEKGQISPKIGSGVTALAVTAALRHGVELDEPRLAKSLKALEGYVHPDGGIYGSDRLRN